MKKEFKNLIFLAMLLSMPLGAQEDTTLDDDDLESLLDDTATAPAETTTNNSTSPAVSEPGDALTSETVDLDALETTEDAPVDTTLSTDTSESPAPGEGTSGAETLEPLPKQGVESTAEAAPSEDEFESLKEDLGDDGEFTPATKETIVVEEDKTAPKAQPSDLPPATDSKAVTVKTSEHDVFDVGREERELLTMANNIQGQISDNEWNEVATAAKVNTYTVVPNDWLFKISKRFFGTGFYYPKIWSLNSYITNPHFIEPGMVLSFTTGSGTRPPEFKLGTFTEEELSGKPGSGPQETPSDLANFGEEAIPQWLKDKKQLENQGIYFQYASEETMDDLSKKSEQALNREYEHYEPPRSEYDVIIPKNYDKSGFDKNSRIFYSFKEGFYLRTFVSTNIVQDFGSLVNGPDENIYFTTGDTAYVKFDESINALAGDRFSIYTSGGRVSHPNSDREGYKYSIVGHVKLIRKIEDKWEVRFTEISGTPQRGDRITAYTPRIERITRTYNPRLIEGAIMTGFEPGQTILGFGDVIYLDRGRADGVELGNVFEIYGFKDRLTNKSITNQPTYKIGELTVITLTDNFATALVMKSKRDFYPGDIALTKTKEAYLREQEANEHRVKGAEEILGGQALEELDVELNLENLNDDLLKQADKIQLTEDELAELERQERDKSVIRDSERDLKALERLENEIESAEKILNDAKLDEDKLLENQSLDEIERKRGTGVDTESLDEIEENLGKRYIDEDLNSRDNPFGLTEFDIEEVDELLNVEKKENQQ